MSNNSPRTDWLRYSASSVKTIANTTTETSQFPSGIGSLTLEPVNLHGGRTFRIRIRGHINTHSSVDTTIRVKLGGVTVYSQTATLPNLTDTATDFDAELRIVDDGSTGHVCMNGMTKTVGSSGVNNVTGRSLYADNVAIDLSGPCLLDVTYQWSTAHPDNALTLTHATVEVLD